METTQNLIADVFPGSPISPLAQDESGSGVLDRRPLTPALTVREARDAYLAENGFDTEGYTAPTFDVEAFGRTFTFTNTPDRKWAIPLHDLHHAATGYGTDLVGEAEVGAFELVGGCRTGVVYALNISAVLIGFAVAPIRTARAFLDARRARVRSLFRLPRVYDQVLAQSLGDLRAELGIPRDGLARHPRRLHDEREARQPDPMPSAPRQPLWLVALGVIQGVATLGTVAFELARGRSLEGLPLDGGGRVVGVAVAAFSLLLIGGALSARRGSLGGRAAFGHAAIGLVVANVVAVAAYGMSPVLALAALVGPLAVLVGLARRARS